VVELAAGECARRGLTVGDRVAWASYAAAHPRWSYHLASTPPSRIGRAPRAAETHASSARPASPRPSRDRARFRDPRGQLAATLEHDTDVAADHLDAHEAVAERSTTANATRAAAPRSDPPRGETTERRASAGRLTDLQSGRDRRLIAAVKQSCTETALSTRQRPRQRERAPAGWTQVAHDVGR